MAKNVKFYCEYLSKSKSTRRTPTVGSSIVVQLSTLYIYIYIYMYRLCGLVVRVLDYRSGGPSSIPGTTSFSVKKKKGKQVVGLDRGPFSLVSTTDELLDKKVAAPV
jgi:hypothetical protein